MDPQKYKIRCRSQNGKFIDKASDNRKMYHQNCAIEQGLFVLKFVGSQLCGFNENDQH